MFFYLPLVVVLSWTSVEGARILAYFPIPTRSHHRFMQPLIEELAVRGHQVTMYAPYLELHRNTSNLRVVQISDYMNIMRQKIGMGAKGSKTVFTGDDNLRTMINVIWYRQFGNDLAEWSLKQKEFKDLIASDSKFDLVFLAASYYQEPFIALSHRFNASTIVFLPSPNHLWAHYLHGSPYDTSYIVDCLRDMADRMNFKERLYNTLTNIWVRLFYSLYFNPRSQAIMDENVRYPNWRNRPSMENLISQSSIVFTNSELATNYPIPLAPHFKDIGGISLQPPANLPENLQLFMDDARYGVIYFSLGSLVETSAIIEDRLARELAQLFGKLKQRVLWKWEKSFTNLSDNIKISKWFPQQDILRHNKTVLFITHGGLMSLTEAVESGVPTIGIPLVADQMKNVRHMEHFGYGLRLHINNLTISSVSWAIDQILTRPEYRENARKRSLLFHDKPATAMETAVFWTEYVIRHNGAHHLKPAVVTMSWYQQAMLDVYAVLALLVLSPLFIIWKMIRFLVNLVLRLSCPSDNKKNYNREKKRLNETGNILNYSIFITLMS